MLRRAVRRGATVLMGCRSTMALEQFNVNFFGQINVTHAVLPYMRERRSGLVIFFGSRSVWKPDAVVSNVVLALMMQSVTHIQMTGYYIASKAAIHG